MMFFGMTSSFMAPVSWRLGEKAARADGSDIAVRLDDLAIAGEHQKCVLVGDEQQCLELAHHLVRAPLLGEFDGRALQIAVVGLELCLEFLEQRERIGDGTGKACQHSAVVDAAHLARRRLHDRVLAKRHLTVTGDGRLAVLAPGADGRPLEL